MTIQFKATEYVEDVHDDNPLIIESGGKRYVLQFREQTIGWIGEEVVGQVWKDWENVLKMS